MLRPTDRILVMSQGRLVEAGTFHALREKNGLFARLLQAGGNLHGAFVDVDFSSQGDMLKPSQTATFERVRCT